MANLSTTIDPTTGKIGDTTPAQTTPKLTTGTAPMSSYPDLGTFGTVLDQMRTKYTKNNDLNNQKRAMLKQIYDNPNGAPISDEEAKLMTPSQLESLRSGNRNLVDMEVRLINDQINNRTNTLDTSVKYLTDTYQTSLTNAENQKKDAQATIMQFITTYGSNAKAQLTSMYSPDGVAKLEQVTGWNIDTMSTMPTLAQTSDLSGGWGQWTDPNTGISYRTNSKTGQFEPIGSVTSGDYTYPTNDNTRIAGNNNLIAAAMSTGSSGNQFTQALDQAGISWSQGSVFSDNANMSTIKINGDPVEAARAILSGSNAIQGWYTKSSSGKSILSQYGVKSNEDFKKLSQEDQNAVIYGIYKGEGGKGTSLPTSAQANLTSDEKQFLTGRTDAQKKVYMGLSDLDKQNVTSLINGEMLISDVAAGMGGAATRKRYLALAKQIDPSFSENTNKIRYAFMQKWNSTESSVGKNRTSINTALGHMADIAEAAKALDPGTVNKMNSVKNVLSKEFKGDPAVPNFRLILNALAGELASVYKNGTAPTDQETEEWRNVLADNFSKKQYQGVFDTASKLLSSKVTAVRYQYKLTMGKEFNQTVIDPDKRQALIDAGINPDSIVKENIGKSINTSSGNDSTSILDNILNPKSSSQKSALGVLNKKSYKR